MRGPIPYTCDVCGRAKQETNHWFLCQRFYAAALLGKARLSALKIAAWDNTLAREDAIVHLCGESCAAIHLSEFLGKLKEEHYENRLSNCL